MQRTLSDPSIEEKEGKFEQLFNFVFQNMYRTASPPKKEEYSLLLGREVV